MIDPNLKKGVRGCLKKGVSCLRANVWVNTTFRLHSCFVHRFLFVFQVEIMNSSSDDDDDPVVKEIDMYLAKGLAEKLFLFQYPVRPSSATYDFTPHFGARIKPQQQKVELELGIDTQMRTTRSVQPGRCLSSSCFSLVSWPLMVTTCGDKDDNVSFQSRAHSGILTRAGTPRRGGID